MPAWIPDNRSHKPSHEVDYRDWGPFAPTRSGGKRNACEHNGSRACLDRD